MTTFKEVAHLYLGCECFLRFDDNSKGDEQFTLYHLRGVKEDWIGFDPAPIELKPILRPLASIDVDNFKDIYRLIFGHQAPNSIQIRHLKANQTEQNRTISMCGVERICIGYNGDMWADSDLIPIKINHHEITAYLLSHHFDLFGLIESSQAIDATKINK